MRPPTPNPTETSLGMSAEREDALAQEARNSRVTRWGRAIARVVLVCSVVILAVMSVAGAGKAIDWVVGFLIPVVVVFGVVVGTCVLLAREGGKAYDGWDKHGRDGFF